jgi:SOS-response transcriptional repressor LexA
MEGNMCYVMDAKKTGEIIKELRNQRDMTQEELAEAIGKSRNYIAMIESGDRQGKFILQQIADVFKVDIEVLYGGKPIPEYTPQPKRLRSVLREAIKIYDELSYRELPVLCRVPCGYPMPNEQDVEDHLLIFKEYLGYAANKPNLYVLIASGDSLEGDEIFDGHKLIIDPEPPDYPEGLIYAVRIGPEVTCKHVYHFDGKIKLISSNSEYKEMVYNEDEVEIKGMVILSGNWKKHYK